MGRRTHDLQPRIKKLEKDKTQIQDQKIVASDKSSVFRKKVKTNCITCDIINLVYLVIVNYVRYEKMIFCLILIYIYIYLLK